MALQAAVLFTDVLQLLPRDQAALMAEDITSLLVVMQVKALGRSRALTNVVPGVPPEDDCNRTEVDWALAEALLGALLCIAGAPGHILRGRIQVRFVGSRVALSCCSLQRIV